MFDLPINPDQFLYTNPIQITIDANGHNPFKQLCDSNIIRIRFAEKIPSNISESKRNIFKTSVPDNKYLRLAKLDKDGQTIIMPNIAIAKIFTIKIFKLIIAYIFNSNINSIDVAYANLMNASLIPYEQSQSHDFRYCTRYTSDNNLIIEDTISIGNINILVTIRQTDAINNNYEEVFYSEYCNILYYIQDVLMNFNKQHITNISIPIYITQMTVSCLYYSLVNAGSMINITKLFNIHNTDKFSKIYIHSFDNDLFVGADREYQHVKSSIESSNVFKGIESLYDTCSMYVGVEIHKGVTLHHINVNANMTIEFVFNNINNVLSYNNLLSAITQWMSDSYIDMLRKLKLSECVYSIDFDYSNYIPFLSNVSSSINMPSIESQDIDSINELIQQYICNVKFKTRSSIQLNMYKFVTPCLRSNIAYYCNIHEFMTTNIMFKDVLPTIHVGLNCSSGGTITLIKASSIEEMLCNVLLIIGCFVKISSAQDARDAKLSLESIRKKNSNRGKKLLKTLESIDPNLFGARIVKGKNRSYSGLCQKDYQRPVPITIDEYNFLKNLVPDSVANIRNQTYPDQRLCLFCPSTGFSFLNYHVFQNQLCIIRCTTKASNKTQYNYCSSSFDAEYQNNIQNKYENQTITLYNPIITPGRKCRLPDELKNILVHYILLKLLIRSGIQQYCLSNYDKYAFIIMRDPVSLKYDVLTEYNESIDYVLILQSEVDDDYFIVLNEINNKPLIFSENDEIRKFFSKCIHKTARQYNFFNYINDLLKVDLTKHYSKSIRELIATLKTSYKINFVVNNNYIRGMIWNNTFIMTPYFYWVFDESDYTNVPLFKVIGLVQTGKVKLPKLAMFSTKRISKVYIDYSSQLVHMILYQNTPVMIEPVNPTDILNKFDTIIFDASTIEDNLSKIVFTKSYSGKSAIEYNKFNSIAEIINTYIFVFLMKKDTVTLEYLEEQLKSLGILYNQKTFINFADQKSQKFISWRSSKINQEDFKIYFEKYGMITPNDCIKYIYKHIHDSLNLVCDKNETISTKILTL